MHSPLGISDNDQNEKRHYILKIYCGVEQLVARRAHNPKVISSSLVPATIEDPSVISTGGSFFVITFLTPDEKSMPIEAQRNIDKSGPRYH